MATRDVVHPRGTRARGAIVAPGLSVTLFYALTAIALLRLKVHHVPPQVTDSGIGDLLANYYPMLRYGFAQLRSGRLPLWNPYQSCGTPFIAIPQIGLFYPVYLPFLFLPADVAVDVDVIIHLTIAALAMYALARHFALGRGAAVVAGLVFAFQSSMMIDLYFPNFLAPVAWTPLLFLLADRILAEPTPRRAALFALVLGVMILGANVEFVYFAALALVPFIMARSVLTARARGVRGIAMGSTMLVAAAALGFALALVRLVPGLEYIEQSWRAPGSLDLQAAAAMALTPAALVRDLLTTAAPPRPTPVWFSPALRREAYVGILPLALALAGVLTWRRRSVVSGIAGAGIGAALYSLGTTGVLFPIIFRLPAGSWFRGPNRALVIFGLAVALLAGAGLDVVFAPRDERGMPLARRRVPVLVLGCIGAVVLGAFAFGEEAGRQRAAFYGAIGAALLVVGSLRSEPRVVTLVAGGLALLVVADLFTSRGHSGAMPSQLHEYFERNDPIYQEIRRRQGLDRTYIWGSVVPAGLFFYSDTAKAGLNHGIWMATDYETLALRRPDDFMAAFGPGFPIGYRDFHLTVENKALTELMGIRFFIVERGAEHRFVDPAVLGAWRQLAAHADVLLYEDPDAMPRAFLTGRVEVMERPDMLRLRLPEADLRRVAFIEEPLPEGALPRAGASGEARIIDYEPQRVRIEVEADAAQFLVLSDQYYPGWQATIDGAPAPIYRTDYLFRGVPVPAGRHRVDFVYKPLSFVLGGAGSLAALVVVGLALWRSPARPI